jgi:POT family proton-dependent oligopeptide transporter
MFGHPKGLFILFMTEMWERFSYYGMRAILVLFLVSTEKGGLGWSEKDALSLYGWYTMLVYVMSIPGGIISDKYLGQKKSVMIGGTMLCLGHLLMAYTKLWAFYTALTLIIIGVGCLKPNISTMVGGLYKEGDFKRDSGFVIFYMGINLGAFLSSLIVGYVGEKYGWHYGFSLAGIGMLIGQATFIYGQKYLIEVGNLVKKEEIKNENKEPLTKVEKDRLLVLGVSFITVLIFWMAFEQAGGFMNIYTMKYTDRNLFGWEIPTSWFQSLNPLFIIIFGGVVSGILTKLALKSKSPSGIVKMGLGNILLGTGFLFMVFAALQKQITETGEIIQKSHYVWLILAYLFHTIGELLISPVALSYITKLSPQKYVASVMGLYFAVTGLSNKLAAEIGKQSEKMGDLNIFIFLFIFPIIVGTILIIVSKKLNELTHGAENIEIKNH